MFFQERRQLFGDIDQAGMVDGFVAGLYLDGGIEFAAEKNILPRQITNLMAAEAAVKQQTDRGGVSCRRFLERELQDGYLVVGDYLNSHLDSFLVFLW